MNSDGIQLVHYKVRSDYFYGTVKIIPLLLLQHSYLRAHMYRITIKACL